MPAKLRKRIGTALLPHKKYSFVDKKQPQQNLLPKALASSCSFCRKIDKNKFS
jgi:hypothetical protein